MTEDNVYQTVHFQNLGYSRQFHPTGGYGTDFIVAKIIDVTLGQFTLSADAVFR